MQRPSVLWIVDLFTNSAGYRTTLFSPAFSPETPQRGLSRKLITSRTALVFSPVSLKRYENTALKKLSEQVFKLFGQLQAALMNLTPVLGIG
jgi:hypothetical protein